MSTPDLPDQTQHTITNILTIVDLFTGNHYTRTDHSIEQLGPITQPALTQLTILLTGIPDDSEPPDDLTIAATIEEQITNHLTITYGEDAALDYHNTKVFTGPAAGVLYIVHQIYPA